MPTLITSVNPMSIQCQSTANPLTNPYMSWELDFYGDRPLVLTEGDFVPIEHDSSPCIPESKPIWCQSVPIHRQSYTNRLPIRCQFSANPVPIQSNQSKAAHLAPLGDQYIDNPIRQSITNTPIQCQSASPRPIHQSQNNPGPILRQSSANLPIACQSNNSWPIHQSTANPISIVYQSTNPLPIVDQFRNPTANVPIKCETWINLKPFTNLWHINPSPIERQSSPIYSQSVRTRDDYPTSRIIVRTNQLGRQSNHSNSNPMSIKCQSYTNRKTIVRLTWEQVYYRDWLKCLDGGWIGHNWQANPMQNQIGTIIQPSHTSPKYVSPMPIHANLGSTRTDTS